LAQERPIRTEEHKGEKKALNDAGVNENISYSDYHGFIGLVRIDFETLLITPSGELQLQQGREIRYA
jgi:hypothetical protein